VEIRKLFFHPKALISPQDPVNNCASRGVYIHGNKHLKMRLALLINQTSSRMIF
ncbi:MAG: hypothetical protein ACI9QL_003872, partial [Candidatus Omnitrophota bacterium]